MIFLISPAARLTLHLKSYPEGPFQNMSINLRFKNFRDHSSEDRFDNLYDDFYLKNGIFGILSKFPRFQALKLKILFQKNIFLPKSNFFPKKKIFDFCAEIFI